MGREERRERDHWVELSFPRNQIRAGGHGVAYVVITDQDATGHDLAKTCDNDDWAGTGTSGSDQRFHTVWLKKLRRLGDHGQHWAYGRRSPGG